ncbi:O-antigen ligase family protein [Allorhodopirellula solitaria]|uniref:O-antigen ligase-related domain-containing protein n=1 Tax=Allorhodopirellula solitaria TaxID=2527987 RepID=A0A5C5WNC7_9BACT|nr:O-antigen ligase family protein [Allorhodopirellula solitaria]TWT52128.1 hypothetical protein CA85_50960 [Allorhodopirellula solitaria]
MGIALQPGPQVQSMLTATTIHLVMLALSCGIAAGAGFRWGRSQALGVGMAISMLSGTWFELDIAGLPISVATSTAIVLLIAYCIHSGRSIWSPVCGLDLAVGALALWNVIVDLNHSSGIVATGVRAYGEWVLPYVAGRYAVLHRGSLSALSPWFCGVVTAIAAGAVFEAFTSTNVWDQYLVPVDDKVLRPTGKRYGLLYRATGPTRHPIFLGLLMICMPPWFIANIEALRSNASRVPAMLWSGITIIAGILSTVSRGPLIGLVIASSFFVGLRSVFMRAVLLCSVLVGCVLVSMYWTSALALIDSTERKNSRRQVVVIDDQPELYSGSRNRVFVNRIYGPIVLRGGLMGYGTAATTGFPPNVPGLPTDPEVRHRLRVVDNSFINVGLRLGIVGLTLFVGVIGTAIATLITMRRNASTTFYPVGDYTIDAMASCLFAMSTLLATVFLAYDFAFWMLFQIGVVGGLASQQASVLRAVKY